jgi:hypothetical protein
MLAVEEEEVVVVVVMMAVVILEQVMELVVQEIPAAVTVGGMEEAIRVQEVLQL